MITRKKTKVIHLGNVAVGGTNPVTIQSMTKTDTRDIVSTIQQIHDLEKLGCDIIRVAVPNLKSVNALPAIIGSINIPLVADIHFDWHLAVTAIENGAHGVRINPGNIGDKKGVAAIVRAAKKKRVPIRIGVNSGSLDKKWLRKYKGATPEALVASAMEYIRMIEKMGYKKLKISLKAPDVLRTVEAYRLIAKKTDYPLHIGITEAGPPMESAIRSSMAIGALLMEGIGDTIRVSVTGDPYNEVNIAKEILQSLGLRKFGPQIISCPTCARCEVDLVKIVNELKGKLNTDNLRLKSLSPKIAVMGCVVNGPGEAKESDIGIACGRGSGVLFKNGKLVRKVKEKNIVNTLVNALSRRKL